MSDFFKDLIKTVYFDLTNNESSVRVKLADIKKQFTKMDAEMERKINKALLDMHKDPKSRAVMYGLDDPLEITEADKKAAIAILPKYPMHVLYIER